MASLNFRLHKIFSEPVMTTKVQETYITTALSILGFCLAQLFVFIYLLQVLLAVIAAVDLNFRMNLNCLHAEHGA